jgi:hypothetical protein
MQASCHISFILFWATIIPQECTLFANYANHTIHPFPTSLGKAGRMLGGPVRLCHQIVKRKVGSSSRTISPRSACLFFLRKYIDRNTTVMMTNALQLSTISIAANPNNRKTYAMQAEKPGT